MTTGYGVDPISDKKICYKCCGDDDRELLRSATRATLYLTKKTREYPGGSTSEYYVSNWPGTLSIKAGLVSKGRHNIAGNRYDVWFRFENTFWHGIQYGDMTQIVHCKRVKPW